MHFKLDHNLLIHQNSSLKNLIADTNGLLAACPKPHIDASCIVAANSESKSISQLSCSISFTAFSVPTLHGEHWPQLSSSKKLGSSIPTQLLTSPIWSKLCWRVDLGDMFTTSCFRPGFLFVPAISNYSKWLLIAFRVWRGQLGLEFH